MQILDSYNLTKYNKVFYFVYKFINFINLFNLTIIFYLNESLFNFYKLNVTEQDYSA